MLGRVVEAGLLDAGIDVEVQARVLARLIDGLGLRSLCGRWDEARATLVAHLGSLGLPEDVVGRLPDLTVAS